MGRYELSERYEAAMQEVLDRLSADELDKARFDDLRCKLLELIESLPEENPAVTPLYGIYSSLCPLFSHIRR